jgi:ribosomal protein L11 methyltransferase
MDAYWSLSIELLPEHRAWLSGRLLELGFAAFEEQSRARRAIVIIYHQSAERLREVEAALQGGAARAGHTAFVCSLGQPGGEWALRWTEHLQPVRLTPSLMLYPDAAAGAPSPGRLHLLPAFAFGFGEHASTRLMATWLEARCRAHPGSSVLDVGCGTGVLALVACLSGAGRVLGVDVSEPAVQASRANAELNGLPALFAQGSAGELSERFECVVANIEAGVLSEESAGIVRALSETGELALAGFIEEQMPELRQCYRRAGVELRHEATEGDWCLLVGRRS